jgi:anti-sigma factor RsiW
MITCPHSERLIALLHDGELDGPLRREMASHAAVCAACGRALSTFERLEELVFQSVGEVLEEDDFSGFWAGVENKLAQPAHAPWRVQLQIWREQWRTLWPSSTPVWATAAVALFISAFLFSRPPTSSVSPVARQEISPPSHAANDQVYAANDQAQIESLSATETVFLWNEPRSNATVIWVSDENDGGLP